MPHKRISCTISEVCQKYGIDYKPGDRVIYNDAKRLGQIFCELKIIAGDLVAIAERHDADGLKDIINQEALNLEVIDHEICQLASKLSKENE
jgi:hypothetical protein